MTLLYFSWVRQTIGLGEETMALPPGIRDVRGLMTYLMNRDAKYASALGDECRVRVAVNQQHAHLDSALRNDDEVAFFPPVTGG